METETSIETAQMFDQNGILFPIPVLSPEEVGFYRTALADLEQRLDCPTHRLPSLHEYFAWAYDLSVHPRVVQAAQEILGQDLVHWGTLVLRKPPRSSLFASWHQDGEYAAFLNGAISISAWIALSDSTAESGCMRVVRGSHKSRVEHVEQVSRSNILRSGQTVVIDVPEAQAVEVELKAGQMSLHHVDIIHGSNPNSSGHDRTGFIVRFTVPGIHPGTRVVKAAGANACSHLELIPRPVDPPRPETFRAYREFLCSPEQSRRLAEG
jgi:non-heme Fe2+,alpha-ketoglutarate-dependent halogenase